MKKKIFEAIPRDILALGSWIFYLLVIIRSLIKPYRPFADQLLIAALVLLIAQIVIKSHESYTSKALVLTFFTSIFYEDVLFAIFAFLIFLSLIFSSYKLKNKPSDILKGALVGIVSALAGFYTPQIYL